MYQPNIHDTLKNNPDLRRQFKSFTDYAAEVKAKKLAYKMLIDSLINQLAEAKAAPLMNNELKEIIAELRTDLEPIKKALKFKINAEITHNWQDELKNKMKTKMALLGGTGK